MSLGDRLHAGHLAAPNVDPWAPCRHVQSVEMFQVFGINFADAFRRALP